MRIRANMRILLVLMLPAISIAAYGNSEKIEFRAPGWGALSYEAPPAGSYELPPIKKAADGMVLRSDNSLVRLNDLMGGQIVILSFIYTGCADLNGCPLANAVLYKVQARLRERPLWKDTVRLLSISFDPEVDTVEVTRRLEEGVRDNKVEWEFLTTRGQSELQPILDGYGQFVAREFNVHGEQTDRFTHLLRVYLIDRDLQVRNIYSVSFLHPDILMNDVETLLLEPLEGLRNVFRIMPH